MNRDLVDIVSDDPPTVRFKFLPNGPGHVEDEYYLTTKVNRCVVCGTTHGLNRHHVLPYCFRRKDKYERPKYAKARKSRSRVAG